ncbi:MAG: beta-lactamase family protein [Tannerella sp.]|nr:beta-lactamase family protein [Tannerella sp.]
MMKRSGKILQRTALVVIAALLLAVAGLYATGNGFVLNALRKTYLKGYTTANIDDHVDFDNHIIRAGVPQRWEQHVQFNRIPLPDMLRKELEDYGTVAFVVVRDGKLWYEEYWDGYSEERLTNSFSMAKSLTTMLLGKALQEGYIRSLDQRITDFIPEFAGDSLGRLCTVGHLSAMTSGFDWTDAYYSPFDPMTDAYYGNHVERLMLRRRFVRRPGGHFTYSSGDTQLLAIVLKRATGKSLAAYFSESFWQPMGMERDALWTVSKGIEKAFCCVHSNARDYARLGQLLLQKGNWNGRQLLDTAFVERMALPHAEAFDSGEPQKYGYSLWVDAVYRPAFYGMMGLLGQRILVIPEKNMVIVRLGKAKDTRSSGKGTLDGDVYYYVDGVAAMAESTVATERD